jgi:hypothetical protein
LTDAPCFGVVLLLPPLDPQPAASNAVATTAAAPATPILRLRSNM